MILRSCWKKFTYFLTIWKLRRKLFFKFQGGHRMPRFNYGFYYKKYIIWDSNKKMQQENEMIEISHFPEKIVLLNFQNLNCTVHNFT